MCVANCIIMFTKSFPKTQTIQISNPGESLWQHAKKYGSDLRYAINQFTSGNYPIKETYGGEPRLRLVYMRLAEDRQPISIYMARQIIILAAKYAQIGSNLKTLEDFIFLNHRPHDAVKSEPYYFLLGQQYELKKPINDTYQFSIIYPNNNNNTKWFLKLIQFCKAPPRLKHLSQSSPGWLYKKTPKTHKEIEELGAPFVTYLTTSVCGLKYYGCFNLHHGGKKSVFHNYWGSGRELNYAVKKCGVKLATREIITVHDNRHDALWQERKELLTIGYLGKDEDYLNQFFSMKQFNPLPFLRPYATIDLHNK